MVPVEPEQVVHAVFRLRELLDLGENDVRVAVLRPVFGQQALHVFRLDRVRLLSDERVNTLLFIVVLSSDAVAYSLLCYVRADHTVLHALLQTRVLKLL